MFMQSLKKISQKLLKLESGNKMLTDGWMAGWKDGWTDVQTVKIFGGYNIISHHFCVAEYNKMTCALSEDSDLPGHPPSLIRVLAVCMKKPWVLSYLLNPQRRLWSDWADAQADLSLRWAHMSFCWFCHEVVNIFLFSFSFNGMGNLLWRGIFAIFISSKNKSLMKIIRLTSSLFSSACLCFSANCSAVRVGTPSGSNLCGKEKIEWHQECVTR